MYLHPRYLGCHHWGGQAMSVTKVSGSKKPSPKGLERAVDAAMKDVQKIQQRATRDLRTEDAIRGISVEGSHVKVVTDPRYEYKPQVLKKIVSDLLAKHGVRAPE